ncbi:MAG: hypothetical protein ACP5OS_07675 [Leptospirillia bacterium]
MKPFPHSVSTDSDRFGLPCERGARLLAGLFMLSLLLVAGCSGFDSFSKEETPQERFVDKITGAVWYQEFRNTHSRVPRIALTAAPGIKTKKLEEVLKARPRILSLTTISPDFTLHIRSDSQAELLDPKNTVVWLAGTDGAVAAPPPAKPVILWRGFYIGPRAEISSISGGTFSGSSMMTGAGVRLGYAFTNLGDISVYMPQISYDPMGATTVSTNINGTSSILTGTVGLSDIMVDPLRFGYPIFSGSTLLSFAIGAGDLMLSQGIVSNTNPEIHLGIDLEYRLFEHFAPYIELVAEDGFIPSSATANYTSGPASYQTPISAFGSSNIMLIRAMVGIDWYPWITKANVSGGASP